MIRKARVLCTLILRPAMSLDDIIRDRGRIDGTSGSKSHEFSTVSYANGTGPTIEYEIADFAIKLDDSNAIAGSYGGNIVCVFST